MKKMSIAALISQKGYIESVPICKTEQKSYYPTVKKSSDEEFTARIVTTISPYLNENLSDNAFLNLQKRILQVLKEHRKECRK